MTAAIAIFCLNILLKEKKISAKEIINTKRIIKLLSEILSNKLLNESGAALIKLINIIVKNIIKNNLLFFIFCLRLKFL
jgi:hypothetical protein